MSKPEDVYDYIPMWEFNLVPYPVDYNYCDKPKLIRPGGMFVVVLEDIVGGFEFFNFMTISSSREDADLKLQQLQKQIPEFFRNCMPRRIAEVRVEEL